MAKHLTKSLKTGRPKGSQRFDPESALAFGSVVREHRLRNEISQEAIAGVVGTDRSYMGRIERGEATPSLTLILQIAKALEIPAAKLIDETEKLLKKQHKENQ